ncbi:efflux RND transporter periplasmic adaptor subunit [Algoriphagus sp. H41]|uniref:Efflux RND transporter periplasmic adaptor subunit n=1 Tax=Algoriphagus oliviformis TaxID=2811231 RepID=A0ABS3C1G0_9BACT|nr:efflux RND transporter periplasmic adaptor subunit [Algoriphagus oliviformis]MBN7810943.1 efflux RND transporter periplasmic adaptor subunit [Algoriphagus oliviformis]
MKSYQFHILASCASLALLSGCGENKTAQPEGIEVSQAPAGAGGVFLTNEQFDAMEMAWGNPVQGDFSREISVQGTVEVPVEGRQEVSAYFGGYVSGLKLMEGQSVKKGEVIFYLENPDFIRLQQDYLETHSQLAYLQAEYERHKTLYGEQISAQKNYLKAEADYQAALAKSQSLKKQLGLIAIDAERLSPATIQSKVPVFSPIAGFVEEVHVTPGAFLPAAGRAVSLLSKEHLHIELVLFEKDAPKVHPGQKVEVSLPDSPGESMLAQVYLVGQSINSERQINVHAHVLDEKEEQRLIPGTFVQARVQLDPKNSWALPEDALVEVDGAYFILVQQGKTAQGYELARVKVQPGAISQGMVAIEPVQGLDESALVLVKGGFNLL